MTIHERCEGILGTQVTLGELEKRLRNALITKAQFVPTNDVVDIGKGIGFASVCGLVTCKWKGARKSEQLPSQIVIKVSTSHPYRELQKALPKEQRLIGSDTALWEVMEEKIRAMHNTEVATYTFLQVFGGLPIPRMFYGLKFTAKIARALGKIQADSLKKHPRAPELRQNLTAAFSKHITLEAFLRVFKRLHALYSSDKALEIVEKVEELLPEYNGSTLATTIHAQMGLRPVLVHGDLRTENVLIDKGSGDFAAIIDWQCTHLGVGIEDLLKITLFALSTKERRESASLLVEEMYCSLLSNLEGENPPYSFDKASDFKAVYDILLPHCAVYFVRTSLLFIAKSERNSDLSADEKANRRKIVLEKVLGSLEDILRYHEKNKAHGPELKFRDY